MNPAPRTLGRTPLVGRQAALATLLEIARRRPGVLVIVGPPGAGTTRLAAALAEELAADGARVVDLATPDLPLAARLASGLRAAGLDPAPERAARLRPLVILAGDCPADSPEPGRLATALAGGDALVVICAPAPPADAEAVLVDPLDRAAALEVLGTAAPGLPEAVAEDILEVGLGRPGRLLAVARAAALAGTAADEPLPLPATLDATADGLVAELGAAQRDLLGWVAIVGTPVTARELARLTARSPDAIARGLAAAVAIGLLVEAAPPGPARWRFADPLVALRLLAGMAGPDRRLRFAAALRAAAGSGRPASERSRLATGARDPDRACDLAIAAAAERLHAGEPEAALAEADRALRWWHDGLARSSHLRALRERGLALADLTRWTDATEALDAAAAGHHAAGDIDEALRCACAASSARWMLGRHAEALRALTDRLGPEESGPPSAARAEALTQAAGIAAATSRFENAGHLAARARAEAITTGERDCAARALVFLGMAQIGRTGRPDGLSPLGQAAAEGEGTRNETLALIHESHALLLLGRAGQAQATAERGIERAAELAIADHEWVLWGNRGDALAALGELAEAQTALERAATGWRALRRPSPTPADPGLAWILLARGEIAAALARYGALDAAAGDERRLLELSAPVATGHALAAALADQPVMAAEIVARQLASWSATDDRLVIAPLLAVGAEVGRAADAERCRAALAGLSGGGSALAGAFRPLADGHALTGGGPGARSARYREAAAALGGLGLRWWAARALLLAGVSAATDEIAVQDLLAARGEYRAMGADGWQLRCEAELRARGKRIPSRAGSRPTRPDQLSERELEVLDQLSLGLTNREIGGSLYISERTVARHVGKILAKLAVGTRTAAVRAARERGLLGVES